MVTFIPKIDPAEIQNPGERKVAEALAHHLPDQVRVIHSLNWVRKRKSASLVEGECDFVVIDPQHGLLFLEVKGGILGFDSSLSGWWRQSPYATRIPLNKDPFRQVQNSMHAIIKCIREALEITDLSCIYGFAVAFPDGVFQGKTPPGVTRQQILDAGDLKDLDKRLRGIFRLFKRRNSQSLTAGEVKRIESAIFPQFDIVPVVWRKVEEQERRLHRLTQEQAVILDALAHHSTALIQGGAGTGKTLLALAKAQQAAQSGMRALLLCYNRPLRDWLNDTAQLQFKQDLTINTYHELVHEFCKSAKLDFNPKGVDDPRIFWKDHAPDLLMQACDLLPEHKKFDAVVIDEGQDFQELWWHSLDSVFKEPENKSCFYAFFDPNQNLYLREDVRPPSELGKPFLLWKNCRNSPPIAEYCDLLINDCENGRAHSLEVFPAESRHKGFSKIAELVHNLSVPGIGGLKPSQIAVLLPGFPTDDWPAKFRKTNTTRDLQEWRNNQGVLIESYARFKGLEADAVIVLTAPVDKENDRLRTLHYVACSRAKHILKIVEVIDKRQNDSGGHEY